MQYTYMFLVFLLLIVFCLSLTVDLWALVIPYEGTGATPNENENYWNLFFRIIVQPFSFLMVVFVFYVTCKVKAESRKKKKEA